MYCSHVLQVSMRVYMQARGQPLELPTLFLRTGSLIGLGLTDWTKSLGQEAPGDFLSPLPGRGIGSGWSSTCLFLLFPGIWAQVPELVWKALYLSTGLSPKPLHVYVFIVTLSTMTFLLTSSKMKLSNSWLLLLIPVFCDLKILVDLSLVFESTLLLLTG